MAEMILPECLMCRQTIDRRSYVSSGGKRKYCSRACMVDHRPILALDRCSKECKFCGQSFKAKSKSNTLYCSRECHNFGIKAEPRKCKCCDILFSPIRWQKTKSRFISDKANNREYCSDYCRHVFRSSGKELSCAWCHIMFTPVRIDKGVIMPFGNSTTCSQECSKKAYPVSDLTISILKSRVRELHPNWQGGTSRAGFRGHEWLKIADNVRIRAGRCCERCGIAESECDRRLDVNHKIPFHQFRNKQAANRMSNLEALCRSCHQITDWEWRRDNQVQLSFVL